MKENSLFVYTEKTWYIPHFRYWVSGADGSIGWSFPWVLYSICFRSTLASPDASRTIRLNISGRICWLQEQVIRKPPSRIIFIALRLISLYPLFALSTCDLVFVNAGGSSITTSYFSPFLLSSPSRSKAFAVLNCTVLSRLFSLAFSVANSHAYSLISTPVTRDSIGSPS